MPEHYLTLHYICDFVSDNEGNILTPVGDPYELVSDPGPTDNRLLDPDPAPVCFTSTEPRRLHQPRCISMSSSQPYDPMMDEKRIASGSKPTVQFNGCIISRGFLKEKPSERLVGSLIGRALLANADALCAAVTPMMNNVFDV